MSNRMRRLILGHNVLVKGDDILGRAATIELIPMSKAEKELGWHWITDEGRAHPAHIDSAYLHQTGFGNTVGLRNTTCHTTLWEHTGILRWLGLDRVRVRHPAAPPYFGRSLELWDAIKSHLRPDTTADPLRIRDYQHISWANGDAATKLDHTKVTDGRIEYRPHNRCHLDVVIRINYPKLGRYEYEHRVYRNDEVGITALEPVLDAYTQGWPMWHKWPAHLLWTHSHKAVWAQDYSAQEVLRLFALHRCADLLGTLSLVDNEWLLAGQVVSYGAGHSEDLELVQAIRRSGLSPIG